MNVFVMVSGRSVAGISLKFFASSLVLFGLTATAASSNDNLELLKTRYKRPISIPFPETAPYSPEVAALGKMLFFDPRLSGMQHMSCASCHNPSFGFEVPVPGATGSANKPLPRKAPTGLNAAWLPTLFWDGRAPDLETQAQGPITADVVPAALIPHRQDAVAFTSEASA